MNISIAREVYELQHMNDISEETFMALLKRGLELLQFNSNTDKLFISRFYRGDDLKAVNIALTYNQELMLKLLME